MSTNKLPPAKILIVAATIDAASGTLRREFQPSSSTGGPGDRLHPNRAGYQAMANAIDLGTFGKPGCF